MRWLAAWAALGIAYMMVFEIVGPLRNGFAQVDKRVCKVHRPIDNFLAKCFAVGCMVLFALVVGALVGPLTMLSRVLPVPKRLQRWSDNAWDWDRKDAKREDVKREDK